MFIDTSRSADSSRLTNGNVMTLSIHPSLKAKLQRERKCDSQICFYYFHLLDIVVVGWKMIEEVPVGWIAVVPFSMNKRSRRDVYGDEYFRC